MSKSLLELDFAFHARNGLKLDLELELSGQFSFANNSLLKLNFTFHSMNAHGFELELELNSSGPQQVSVDGNYVASGTLWDRRHSLFFFFIHKF